MPGRRVTTLVHSCLQAWTQERLGPLDPSRRPARGGCGWEGGRVGGVCLFGCAAGTRRLSGAAPLVSGVLTDFAFRLSHRRTPSTSGKRGTTSRAQKRRKVARLEKGMAHAARVDAKAMKLSSSKASRKVLKGLWQSSKDGKE